MKTKEELIKSWINKAEKDLLTVKHELSFPDAVTESICFHCQQAVEKFLKAYLVFLGIPFTKTHEIGELITKCENKDNEIATFKEEADKLTDYAIDVRYPEESLEPTLKEANEAFEIAKKIKEYISRAILRRYNMNKEVVQPAGGEKSSAPLSPGIKAGGFIYVSGQVPVDPQTGEIVTGGIKEQTRQTLENIKAVLEAGGSSMDKVVKCTVFLTDISEFSQMNEVYSSCFPQDPPARSTVEVSKLAIDIKVEIEAVAIV